MSSGVVSKLAMERLRVREREKAALLKRKLAENEMARINRKYELKNLLSMVIYLDIINVYQSVVKNIKRLKLEP